MKSVPITPRDEREEQLIAEHQQALGAWVAVTGPLLRRRSDGKLIRLPDLQFGHKYDAQVGADLFVLGRGPGRNHGVIAEWIAVASAFPSWDATRQAAAIDRALRNHQIMLDSLRTNPPAPQDAHKFADVTRPFPAWAKVQTLAAPVAPVAPVRAERLQLTPVAV